MTPNDGAGPTPERDDAPPRTVAEEAALLVDLLSQRRWTATDNRPAHDAPAHDGSAPDGSAAGTDGSRAYDHPDGAAGPKPTVGSARECTCGGTTPAACRVCPVCQVISFVQQVSPETIDRVADFAVFAAGALRDLAAAQRDRTPTSPDAAGPAPSSTPAPSEPESPTTGAT